MFLVRTFSCCIDVPSHARTVHAHAQKDCLYCHVDLFSKGATLYTELVVYAPGLP